MIIDSKYTKVFVSDDITRLKYNELHDVAVNIRDHKNKVSEFVSHNLLKYLDYSNLTFMKEMRTEFKNQVGSSFDAQLYTQVLTCYQNKFDNIRKNLTFEKVTYSHCELYKRNTKKNKKGDFKRVVNKHETTRLSICLSYLARYGNDNTVEYINSQMPTCDDNKKGYYQSILDCCSKFGFERLMGLAMQKRQRAIDRYKDNPIEFKSLTFSGRSRKKKILDWNKNYNSEINAFVSLSGFDRKSMDIPVKFAKDYHGSMGDYFKANPDYEYTIVFSERRKSVSINLCKDGERFIPEAGNNLIGIDVNCKHNLFSLSDNSTYDYDRQLVNDYCRLALDIDKRKKKDKEYQTGKRTQWKLDTLKKKMDKSEQNLIALMCKQLASEGYNHIVMEDLDNGFGRCYAKDNDNDDINYNRKVKFLGLSSLKNEVEHIARNYGIALSTVQASYTSKMCPICGCIEDENRPDQETFCCVECGHSSNADFNASVNIRNRVSEAVLRDRLLKQKDNGAYEPKKMKREKVKEVLLSFRKHLQKAGSECIQTELNTFEYV